MMKLLFFISILLVSFIKVTYTQTLSWCTPGAKWTVRQDFVSYFFPQVTNSPPELVHYEYLGETNMNGFIYQIIREEFYSFNNGLFYTDSIYTRKEGNKIFLRQGQFGSPFEEGLLVDYDWNVGDTVNSYNFLSVLAGPDYENKQWVIENGTEIIQGIPLKYIVLQYKKRIYYGNPVIGYYDTLVVQKFNERIGPWDNWIYWCVNWSNIDDFACYFTLNCYSDNQMNINFNTTGFNCFDNLGNVETEMQTNEVIYPNPVDDFFILPQILNDQTELNIEIYDVQGKLSMSIYRFKNQHNKIQIPTDLKPGVYFVKVWNNSLNPVIFKILKL